MSITALDHPPAAAGASAGKAAARPHGGGARAVVVSTLNYLTNHVVNGVPSYRLRHAWYRRVVGMDLGAAAVVHMGCYVWFFGPGQVRRSGVRVGHHTRINRHTCLDARGGLDIGANVSISPDVAILTAQHDHTSPGFRLELAPVTVEDHVWIGTRATILPGSHIGRGAVVAAGAVVRGSVAPMTVVAGTPARPVAARPEAALDYTLADPAPLFE